MFYYFASPYFCNKDQAFDFTCVSMPDYNIALSEYLQIELNYIQIIITIMVMNKVNPLKNIPIFIKKIENYKKIKINNDPKKLSDFEDIFRKSLRTEIWTHLCIGKNSQVEINFGYDMCVYIASKTQIPIGNLKCPLSIVEVSKEFWLNLTDYQN